MAKDMRKQHGNDKPMALRVRQELEKPSMIERFMKAAGTSGLDPRQQIQVISTVIHHNERLGDCTFPSIVSAITQGVELGLSFNPRLGQCYLVPRYNKKVSGHECHFEIGYQGMVQLAYRSGQVSLIDARLVREKEMESGRFELRYQPELYIRHEPIVFGDGGDVVGVYAVAKLKTGEWKIVTMNLDEIEAVHRMAESYKTATRFNKDESGPWVDWWEQQALKCPLRRLFKYIPHTPEVESAIDAHDQNYNVTSQPASKSQALAAQLEAKRQSEQPEPAADEVVDVEPEPEPEPESSINPDDYGGGLEAEDAPPQPEPKPRPKPAGKSHDNDHIPQDLLTD